MSPDRCYRPGCVRLATREVDGVKCCGYHDPSHARARTAKREAEKRDEYAWRAERDQHYRKVATELSELLGIGITAASTRFASYSFGIDAAEVLLARLKTERK